MKLNLQRCKVLSVALLAIFLLSGASSRYTPPPTDTSSLISSILVSNTLYVDSSATSGGVRGDITKPFALLSSAVAAASAGDLIVIQGTQSYSGNININKAGLILLGRGNAKIPAVSEANVLKLQFTAANITIKDVDISGGRVSSTTPSANGLIEVTASGATIENCTFHDSVGIGVRVLSDASNATVRKCHFSNVDWGVVSTGTTGHMPNNLKFDENVFDTFWDTTADAIRFSTPDGVAVSTNVEANFNYIYGGDVCKTGIEAWRNHRVVRVLGNYIERCQFLISVDAGFDTIVSGNTLGVGATSTATFCNYGIEVPNGGDGTIVNGNIVDGLDSTGTSSIGAAVSVSNSARSHNLVISNNVLRGFRTNGLALTNADNVSAFNNNIVQEYSGAKAILLKNVSYSNIRGGTIYITAGDSPIYLDSSDAAMSNNSISGILFHGSPSGKLIQLHANINNIDKTSITTNRAFDVTFLSSGFIMYDTSNGGTITNTDISNNLPDRVTPANNQFGWDNNRYTYLGTNLPLASEVPLLSGVAGAGTINIVNAGATVAAKFYNTDGATTFSSLASQAKYVNSSLTNNNYVGMKLNALSSDSVEINAGGVAAKITARGTGVLTSKTEVYSTNNASTPTLAATFANSGILGWVDASNASAGNVGEYISSLIASGSAVSLTTATGANVTSISLTAGDWDVEGNINISGSTATYTQGLGGISTTTATVPSDGSEVYSGAQFTALTVTDGLTLPRKRINVNSTTTVYLVAKATFSAGTMTAFGSINARRVR